MATDIRAERRSSAKPVATHPRALYLLAGKDRLKRFKILIIVFLLLFAAIVFKLVEIQFIRAGFYQEEAKKFRTHSTSLYSRGRLLDRNGQILAQDVIVYDIYSHPSYYYKQNVTEMAEKIAPVLQKKPEEVYQQLTQKQFTITIAKGVDKSTANKIMGFGYSGIEMHRKMIRKYPQGQLASHVIGYVNDEAKIASGVEQTAFETLRQVNQMPETEFSANGDLLNLHKLKADFITNIPRANDVELTIDSRIQYAAEQALTKGLLTAKAERGCVIVMEPKTGELLAFASAPSFSPEKYYKAKAEELKNWAITDVYPPGSTMKILTVAAGLESGVINRNSTIYDSGKIQAGTYSITNYDYAKTGAPGNINLVYLLQHSSNIASYKISNMIPKETHYALLKKFGFGDKTGLDLTGESSGILDSPDNWSDIQHGTMGFGYGLASTPLQMAAAFSAIANNGVWVTPHVQRDQSKIVKRRVVSEKTAVEMADILSASIENSKTATYYLPGYNLAGKTGTSRKPAENGKGYSSDVFTSFAGYFPAEDPRVLIMVVVDSPKIGNAWGATVAGPIFHDIAIQTAGFLGIKPVTMQNKAAVKEGQTG